MKNFDCKRCLTKEKEKYYEIKLGQQQENNANISEYKKDNNSQKIENIIEKNPKEEISIVKSDLNNTENLEQNILDEDKIQSASKQKIIQPINKNTNIIQVPLLSQKDEDYNRNYLLKKNDQRNQFMRTMHDDSNIINGNLGFSSNSPYKTNSTLPADNDNLGNKKVINKLTSGTNKIENNMVNNLSNEKNNLNSGDNNLAWGLIDNLKSTTNNLLSDNITYNINISKNINENKLWNASNVNNKSEINVDNSTKEGINSNKKLILLDCIKSNYILRKIIQNLNRKTFLYAIKYNKQLQKRLNIGIKDYEAYLQTEIEIKLGLNYPNLDKLINYKYDKSYYHIYLNGNEQESKKEGNITKVRIIIERHVKSFQKLFYRSEAKEINFIRFNRKDITNMNSMFKECRCLEKLNISNFNTENVTNMGGMFSGCTILKELDVSKFKTSKVKNMNNMFEGCSALEQLDLENFETSKVNDMKSMFKYCTSLKKIKLENFDTKNVINMSEMFRSCYSLVDLDISKFKFDNFPIIYSMFSFCLESLKCKIRSQIKLYEEAFYDI